MGEKIRVVHYLHQFFAQIGGEEKADIGPGFKEGPMGPGRALQQTLGQQGEVVAYHASSSGGIVRVRGVEEIYLVVRSVNTCRVGGGRFADKVTAHSGEQSHARTITILPAKFAR